MAILFFSRRAARFWSYRFTALDDRAAEVFLSDITGNGTVTAYLHPLRNFGPLPDDRYAGIEYDRFLTVDLKIVAGAHTASDFNDNPLVKDGIINNTFPANYRIIHDDRVFDHGIGGHPDTWR